MHQVRGAHDEEPDGDEVVAVAAGGAVPEYGPIIFGVIKVAGTVIGFTQVDESPYIDFSTTLKIEAQASKLESAVNTEIEDMYGAISTRWRSS